MTDPLPLGARTRCVPSDPAPEPNDTSAARLAGPPAHERASPPPPDSQPPTASPIGRFYAWWQGDPLPPLPSLPGFAVETPADPRRLAALSGLPEATIRARLAAAHRPYLARLGPDAVAWGWSAAREAAIGSAGLALRLPPRQRYLWDFLTLPRWRGRGLYPRLLQAVLTHETPSADRFWIGHDWDNAASHRGILTAGFQLVAELHQRPDCRQVLYPRGPAERSRAASHLLGIALQPARPAAEDSD